MTWVGDENEKVQGDAREKLLKERAKIVREIEILSMKPLRSNTRSAQIGRTEDLTNLAKKIKIIDKKLGRIIT